MIPVVVLEAEVAGHHPFHLGHAPGSSLRGALYAALGTLYDTGEAVSVDHWEDNPVGWLLRLQDDEQKGGKDVPRPLSLRPPLAVAGDRFNFGVTLYGAACAPQVVSLVASALPMMGQLGIGRGRQTFSVQHIAAVDPLTGVQTPLVDADGSTVGDLPTAPSPQVYERMAALLRPDALTVEFLTPTRVVQGGKLVHRPHFRPWIQRLLSRVRDLSKLYTDTPLWVPFKDLLAVADTVTTVQDDTQWVESWSGSRRDGMMKPLGGYVGRVRYQGDVTALLPYILLGQTLQVGKNTVKGCGWYRVIPEWAA